MSEWQPIETAPRDGTHIIGRTAKCDSYVGMLYRRQRTWYGKTSHVPLYGWCYKSNPRKPDCEDVDLWEPTHWKPLPAPPAVAPSMGDKG